MPSSADASSTGGAFSLMSSWSCSRRYVVMFFSGNAVFVLIFIFDDRSSPHESAAPTHSCASTAPSNPAHPLRWLSRPSTATTQSCASTSPSKQHASTAPTQLSFLLKQIYILERRKRTTIIKILMKCDLPMWKN
jgi:hypothetical protein